MPYASTAELPPGVRNALPAHGQEIYMKAFNAALKTYDGDEARAARIAWGAVKRSYRKVGEKWVARETAGQEARQFHEAAIPALNVHVDRQNRIIRDVAVLGRDSDTGPAGATRRRYTFSDTAMASGVPLVEGLKVYVNHNESGRRFPDMRDLIGQAINARYDREEGRLRADIRVRKSPDGDQLLDDAEANPDMVGFSLDHMSEMNPVKREISRIVIANRLDCVANPATTRGMFEARDEEDEEVTAMEWDQLTIDELKANAPEVYAKVFQEGKAATEDDAETAALKAQNQQLQTKVAAFEQREAEREKIATVEKLLADNKIAPTAAESLRPVLMAQESRDTMEAIVRQIAAAAQAKRTMSQEAGANEQTADPKDVRRAWQGR